MNLIRIIRPVNFLTKGIRTQFRSVQSVSESTNSAGSQNTDAKLVYEGKYWKSLRRIRRVSLGSCITGLIVVVCIVFVVYIW